MVSKWYHYGSVIGEKMANLNIRKLPDKAYKKIKELAKQNRRSINSEVVYILTDALDLEGPYSKKNIDLFSEILKIRKKKLHPKHIDSVKLIREMRDIG